MCEIDVGYCSTQLINGNGDFKVEGLDNFVKKTKLSDCGLSYAVVAIMGPQSSGKSTLLNHLFKTNFREMDASTGRCQTTKGIWMAKCVGIEPFTVAMDLEGTDGRERGEDDTTFEKQSALFALAVADIVLINIWCHDIGREQASNKPLLKTIFQVMTQLCSPRKTTLLFVIRDKTETPMEKLESLLMEDIQKIWDLVRKSEAHKNTPLSEFFNVEVVALSHYVHQDKLFEQEVAELRLRFFHSISLGGLAGERRDVVSASGLSFSFKQIWKRIKENRDLNIPAHKVLVATVRCEEIANEKLQKLATDKSWLELQKAVKGGPVPHFGKKLSCILEKYLSEYDAEAIYFDEGVRKEKCVQLKLKAKDFVYPAYATMLGHLRSSALESFKIRLEESLNQGEGFAKAERDSKQSCLIVFDKGCEAESSYFSLCFKDAMVEQATVDTSIIREKLCRHINAHSSSARDAKLSELTANYEKRLIQALGEPVASFFEAGGKETWPSIRKLLKQETETSITDFQVVVAGFELDHAKIDAMVQNLKDYSQSVVEKKAREEAAIILFRMKDRFSRVFSHDKDSMPRTWTGTEDISAITKDARSEALSLLAVMVAIRLDERPDNIESTLFSSIMDPLGSSSWEEVPTKDVLLTPVQCKSLWTRLISETEYFVIQAIHAQEASKQKQTNNAQEDPKQKQTNKFKSSLKTASTIFVISASVVLAIPAVLAVPVVAAVPAVAAVLAVPAVAAAVSAVAAVAAVPAVAAAAAAAPAVAAVVAAVDIAINVLFPSEVHG